MERSDPLDTTDIQGATTRRLPSRSTPHPFNTNEDIDFSRPFSRTTHPKSQRSTNPLVPAYVLPSSTYVPVLEAKAPPAIRCGRCRSQTGSRRPAIRSR